MHIFGYLYRKIPENIELKITLCSTFRATGTPMVALYEFLGRFYDNLVTYRAGFSNFCFYKFFRAFLGQNFPIFTIFWKNREKVPIKMTQKQKFVNPALYTQVIHISAEN